MQNCFRGIKAASAKLRAERRLAQLIDQGQAAGKIAKHGTNQHARTPSILTLADLGMTTPRLTEARKIAQAFEESDLIARANS